MTTPTKIAGAVIAGGRSSRMGLDKTQLRAYDKTLLEHAVALLKSAELTPVLVSHSNHIPDRIAGCGPLSGIDAILDATPPEVNELVFIPVDMPGLTQSLLKTLCDASSSSPCVRIEKYPFPFRLTNTPMVANEIRRRLKTGHQLSLLSLQEALGVTELHKPRSRPGQGSGLSEFTNVNTPSQWRRFLEAEAKNESSD